MASFLSSSAIAFWIVKRYSVAATVGLTKESTFGINQWLRDQRENKVVILHGHNGENLQQKRFWYWKWEDYERAGKVIHVRKWLSECTVDDLTEYLKE